MKSRILAVSITVLSMLGAGSALADMVLYTPMLSPPTGGLVQCNVTNVGKKPLREVVLRMLTNHSAVNTICPDLPTAAMHVGDHTCSAGRGEAALCQVTISGGTHRSVRAVLNVVDSSGATILSVPATK